MTTQSRRMVVDGVELHWTERGRGTALVILHGLGDSQHTWAAVAAELAQRYRVLCLDLPGCGRSGRPDAAYGLDWQARLVAKWLDHMHVDSLDVLGHSYGGGVALWLLLHRAGSVRRMALIAPGGLGAEVTPLLRIAAIFGPPFERCGQRLIGPITRLILRRYGGTLSALEQRELCQMNAVPGSARAFSRTVRDVIGWRGQTRSVRQHVHRLGALPSIALFWGEQDRVIPVHHGEALRTLFENCSLVRLPGGHFLHWDDPRALASAVLAYLQAPEAQRCQVSVARRLRGQVLQA